MTYTINFGDTLQGISEKFGVQDWRDLAVLNNLKPPFILDEVPHSGREERLIYIGDSITVPQDSVVEAPVEDSKLEKLVYGSDLALTRQGLSLEPRFELVEDNSGDIALVIGSTNLQQACLTKLSVVKGTLPLHPEFGTSVNSQIGEKATHENLVKVQLEVERILKSDSRVDRVENVSVTTVKTGLLLECDIIPIKPLKAFRLTMEV